MITLFSATLRLQSIEHIFPASLGDIGELDITTVVALNGTNPSVSAFHDFTKQYDAI